MSSEISQPPASLEGAKFSFAEQSLESVSDQIVGQEVTQAIEKSSGELFLDQNGLSELGNMRVMAHGKEYTVSGAMTECPPFKAMFEGLVTSMKELPKETKQDILFNTVKSMAVTTKEMPVTDTAKDEDSQKKTEKTEVDKSVTELPAESAELSADVVEPDKFQEVETRLNEVTKSGPEIDVLEEFIASPPEDVLEDSEPVPQTEFAIIPDKVEVKPPTETALKSSALTNPAEVTETDEPTPAQTEAVILDELPVTVIAAENDVFESEVVDVDYRATEELDPAGLEAMTVPQSNEVSELFANELDLSVTDALETDSDVMVEEAYQEVPTTNVEDFIMALEEFQPVMSETYEPADSIDEPVMSIQKQILEVLGEFSDSMVEDVEVTITNLMNQVEIFASLIEPDEQIDCHQQLELLAIELFEQLGIEYEQNDPAKFVGYLIGRQMQKALLAMIDSKDLKDVGTYEQRLYPSRAWSNIGHFLERQPSLQDRIGKLATFHLTSINLAI